MPSLKSHVSGIDCAEACMDYSINQQFKLGAFDALYWDGVCLELEKDGEHRQHLLDALRSVFEVSLSIYCVGFT